MEAWILPELKTLMGFAEVDEIATYLLTMQDSRSDFAEYAQGFLGESAETSAFIERFFARLAAVKNAPPPPAPPPAPAKPAPMAKLSQKQPEPVAKPAPVAKLSQKQRARMANMTREDPTPAASDEFMGGGGQKPHAVAAPEGGGAYNKKATDAEFEYMAAKKPAQKPAKTSMDAHLPDGAVLDKSKLGPRAGVMGGGGPGGGSTKRAAKSARYINCLNCGFIEYDREDICTFCGSRLIWDKTEAMAQALSGARPDAEAMEALHLARKHKDKLLDFDKNSTKREYVYDDQADYFADASSSWLSEEERAKAQGRGKTARARTHARTHAQGLAAPLTPTARARRSHPPLTMPCAFCMRARAL